jgi:hypothetical protein
MVLKFRLISNEQDDFVRDFEVLAEQTFFHLHMALQENLHYDKSQIASFFTCTEDWEKEQEITLFELSDEESAEVITMENAVIGDHIQDVHDKMIYIFDVFNERMFFIELVDIHSEENGTKYPCCCYEKGQAPQQLLMDQLFGNRNFSDSSILDDVMAGDEFTSTDDLDELGYDSEIFDDDFPDES